MEQCICNANSRSGGGFSGIAVNGTANFENLAVTLLACDTTSNGFGFNTPAGGTGTGVSVLHSRGVQILGHYGENNREFGIYADNTVRSLTCQGGWHMDEHVRMVNVQGLGFVRNHFDAYTANRAQLSIVGGTVDDEVRGNTRGGTQAVAFNFSQGAGQIREIRDSAPPSLSGLPGPWARGDRCWNTLPTPGGVAFWVCVADPPTGGAAGTWAPGAMIPA